MRAASATDPSFGRNPFPGVVLDTLQRLAAAVPPDFVALAVLIAAVLVTGVLSLRRRPGTLGTTLPVQLYVVAAAFAVLPDYVLRLSVRGRVFVITTALVALAAELRRASESTDAMVSGLPPASGAIRGHTDGRRVAVEVVYVLGAIIVAGFFVFWRLGTYAGSLLAWEESVINGFAESFRAGQGVLAYARRCLLWDEGLLSAGDTSLLYGVPTYAWFHVVGFSLSALRSAAAVAVLLSAAACYAAVGRGFGRRVAAVATVLLVLNTTVLFYGRYGTSEAGTLLAVLLALWATWSFLASDRAAWWLGPVCGIALYVATLQYSPARLVVLVLLGFIPVVVAAQWRQVTWRRVVGLAGLAMVVVAVWRTEVRFGRQDQFLSARGEQVLTFVEHRDYIREYLGREIEPGTLNPFEKIELVYRVLAITVPQFAHLVQPSVNPVPPGAAISVDPPPLPLYFAPLAVFVVWGLGVSLARWRAWPHACLLLWVGATSVPLVLTTRVDVHRTALLVIPISVWAALGLVQAAAVLDRAGVPRAIRHGLACVLLATVVWSDANLLYFSVSRQRSALPYAFDFGKFPTPHEPTTADSLVREIDSLPGPVAVGMVLDPRDRGWIDLALLQRTWRDPPRTSQVLPEGLVNDLRMGVVPSDTVARVARVARGATVLLVPATLFPAVDAALEPRGLRIVRHAGGALPFLEVVPSATAGANPAPLRRFPPGPGPTVAVATTAPSNPRQWVSAATPREMTYGFMPPRMDRAWDGGPIEMGGNVYEHGIGVHAWTRLTFAVPDAATTFEAVIGLADDTRECEPAAVTFEVLDDAGRSQFDSGLVLRGDPPCPIRVPIAGTKFITLVVTEGGNGRDCDHANWGDAAFIVGGAG